MCVLLALLLSLLLLSQLGLTVESEKPEVVLTNPAEGAELSIKVWLDEKAYEAGDRLKIHFIISRDCYIYIYDISPQGKVTLLFPNAFQENNFLKAGHYTLPDKRYSLVVEGQAGIEYIQALASSKPIAVLVVPQSAYKKSPFPLLSTEPQGLKKGVMKDLSPTEWAADWTSFYLLEPGRARLVISSKPKEAKVYINGEAVGSTPLAVSVKPGFVRVLLRKEGYESWSERIYLERNEVEEIAAHLEEAAPSAPPPLLPTVPQAPSTEETGRAPLTSLGFNLGIDWESLGVELGLFKGLRLGMAARFTGNLVPDYYGVSPPSEPWPDERVYNDGPEIEVYLKLTPPLGRQLALALGGGLAVQEQIHIAAPPSGSGLPQDVTIKPNGYKTTENYFTLLGGLIFRFETFFLELDYHSRRGLLLGAGIAF